MRLLLVAAALVASALASEDHFLDFTREFGKRYTKAAEMIKRRDIFLANYEKMVQHNARYEAGLETWAMKVYEDMDLTEEEWADKYLSGLPAYDNNTVFLEDLHPDMLTKLENQEPGLKEFSWVSSGAVSSVKNQAQCGSCAAFSAVGAIESCFYLATGVMFDDLSEQHLLDCAFNHYYNDNSGSWGAFGCDGAWPQAYLDWLLTKGPWNQKEQSYPYTSGSSGQVTSCHPTTGGFHTAAMVTGMYNKWYTNENDMEAVVMINPTSTSLQATNNWGGYSHGVLNDPACCNQNTDPNCRMNLNHAILVVGFGHDAATGLDYWLIKNSWGKTWGENGYLKLKRGTGHCGVGTLHHTIPYCKKA
jgi:Papain family cysteine protease